ncbi:DNA-binding response regulator, OmpR family, contains REC and winged-helix (wHTH) domain [Fontibacillus panacisegetis]|uniref:DNA-binding response regulator, OmpR family, contains REC and winged-helix (WHTH) domain n=1 Tax=Fontibacillus panacisegetis TaxID=670482 RepID=A0A1G7EJG2_9BACL|nr:response regulator transcription factor [Fontibacillus panacisegetis]SDE63781.1 DNA-binding response regulator, OmpR family, contains REC and winged-helix (wHTH) domain [Fontibacillus panacisegetis]
MGKQILIVDDDEKIAKLIEIYLLNEGYTVFKADDGYKALEMMDIEAIDLVVLDVMMPGLDGITVCLRIRETRTTPILMLSAKDGDMDKITGLMTGADDYMVKPFNPLELVARVKSLLRRASYAVSVPQQQQEHIIKISSLQVDKETHTATVEGNALKLTPIEFGILYLLASHPGRVFSSEEIFELIWKDKYFESNNSVTVHISRLRDKLEKEMDGEKLIRTVWGVGYKIEG